MMASYKEGKVVWMDGLKYWWPLYIKSADIRRVMILYDIRKS